MENFKEIIHLLLLSGRIEDRSKNITLLTPLFNYTAFFKKLKLATFVSLPLLLFLYMIILKDAVLIIVLSVLTIWTLIRILRHISKMKDYVKEVNKYRFTMYDFMLDHNLYVEEQGRFSASAIFSVIEKQDELTIIAHKTGDMFTKKLATLDEELTSFVGIELFEKLETPLTVEYFFREKPKINQLVFKPNELTRDFFENIPLDTIILSPTQIFSLKSSSMMGLYGRTGTGKTVALQWILINAISKGSGTDLNSVLTIVDGKGGDLHSLGCILEEELVGNISAGQTPHDLAKLSREFVKAMDERFKLIGENSTLNADGYDLALTPSFLFVDELASIKDTCGSSKEGKNLWNEVLQNLSLVAKKGRQASCHLILSTQDPNAENIPVELRNQITSVIYLSNPGKDRLKMAFSMCELENVPTLSGRKGEALFYADGRNQTEPEVTIVPLVSFKTKQEFRTVINNIKPNPNNFI